jgi:hypothetical protein
LSPDTNLPAWDRRPGLQEEIKAHLVLHLSPEPVTGGNAKGLPVWLSG